MNLLQRRAAWPHNPSRSTHCVAPLQLRLHDLNKPPRRNYSFAVCKAAAATEQATRPELVAAAFGAPAAPYTQQPQAVLTRPNVHDGAGRLYAKALTLEELRVWFQAHGERLGRADQLWKWLYGRTRQTGAAARGRRRNAGGSGNGSGSSDGDSSASSRSSSRNGSGDKTAEELAAAGFSPAFVARFSSLLTLDGGLALEGVATASDGTRKMQLRLTGGEAAGGRVEAVLIPWFRDYDPRVGRRERPRYTLCVSSQVGCAMNCQFCYTGRQGLLGNLSTAQIVEQVLMAQQLLEAEPLPGPPSEPRPFPSATSPSSTPGPTASSPSPSRSPSSPSSPPPPITNIVFMGMGEPLHNAPAVFAAIDTLTHRSAFGLAASRITLSTVGLLPQLQHFLDRYGPEPLAHQHQQHHHQEHVTGSAAASPVAGPALEHDSDARNRVRGTGTSCTSSTSSSGSWPKDGPGGVEAPGRGPGGGRPLVSLAVSLHAGSDALRDVIVPSNTRLRAPPAATAHPRQQEQQASHHELSRQQQQQQQQQQQDVLGAGPHAAADGSTVVAVAGGVGGGGGGGVSRLMSVLAAHYPRTDRRPLRAGRYVLFEYTMLGGINDRPLDAAALLEATRDVECSFNLIMFNPFPGTIYQPCSRERVLEFQKVLWAGGRIVHVRHSKGDSGMAACGQLGDVGRGGGRGGRCAAAP